MLSFSTLKDEVSESKTTFAGPVIYKVIIVARDCNLDMKHCIKNYVNPTFLIEQ